MNADQVKMFRIGYAAMVDALKNRVTIEGLPEDFKILSVNHDFQYDGFLVKGASSEFEEVGDGCLIPTLEVQFHRKPLKEKDIGDLTRRFCE